MASDGPHDVQETDRISAESGGFLNGRNWFDAPEVEFGRDLLKHLAKMFARDLMGSVMS